MSNGFTFGGTHSSALGLIVNRKSIPATPTINNRLQEIGGTDGAWDYGITYGPREIEIEVTILGDSPIETKRNVRKLVGAMNPKKGPQKLVFDDEPDIFYNARISNQVPLETLGSLGTFTLQLTCPDPFAYSLEERSFSFGNSWTWTVEGTEEAAPLLTITHNGGSGTVTHTRPDGSVHILTFKDDSPSGVYSIDCKKKTATIDGNRAYNYISGGFLSLPVGSNKLESSSNVSRTNGSYYDTWI